MAKSLFSMDSSVKQVFGKALSPDRTLDDEAGPEHEGVLGSRLSNEKHVVTL
jgi:hypothetical protein